MMSDQPGSSCFRNLFEYALQDYENQTGMSLAKHPLAERLQNCDSNDSLTAVLQEQARAFHEFRGHNRIIKYLKSAVSILSKLSVTTTTLGDTFGLVLWEAPWVLYFSLTVIL